MKKLIVLLVFAVSAGLSFGQVQVMKGTLDEAIAKAKAEKKKVLIMGSTTWCGPCKALEAQVFPSKRAGDALNPKVVIIKYELDVDDKEKIASRYKIESYPTFVVVDYQGREVNRFLGALPDVDNFIERVTNAINSDVSFVAYEERMKEDISVGLEYAKHLHDADKFEKSNEVLMYVFNNRKIKDNFNQESVNYYSLLVDTYTHPIFQFILEKKNLKKVKKVMGAAEFENFMQQRAIFFARDIVAPRLGGVDMEKLDNFIELLDKYPSMKSGVTEFIISNKDAIIERNIDVVFPQVLSNLKSAKAMEVDLYVALIRVPMNKRTQYKDSLIELYTIASQKSSDEMMRESYKKTVDRLNFDPKKDAEQRADKFKQDANYANEYFNYLYGRGRRDEAVDMLKDAFNRRDINNNFSQESLAIYKNIITDADNYILLYMLDSANAQKIIGVMGKNEYFDYIDNVTTQILASELAARTIDVEKFKKDFVLVGKDKIMSKNQFYQYVKLNYNTILNRDYAKMLPQAIAGVKGKKSEVITAIVATVQKANREQITQLKDYYIELFIAAAAAETDEEAKQKYITYAERFKTL